MKYEFQLYSLFGTYDQPIRDQQMANGIKRSRNTIINMNRREEFDILYDINLIFSSKAGKFELYF